jgi:hypothetical protein
VIGVFEESLVDLIGNALIEIGSIEHAVVVHGCGLDEISPLGASTIYEIRNTAGNGSNSINNDDDGDDDDDSGDGGGLGDSDYNDDDDGRGDNSDNRIEKMNMMMMITISSRR